MNASLILAVAVAVGFAGCSLGVVYGALRQARTSERLARRAELELDTRQDAAVVDEGRAAGAVSDDPAGLTDYTTFI